jgi:hypothetical protein
MPLGRVIVEADPVAREGGVMGNKDKGGSKDSKKQAQKSLKEKRQTKKNKKAAAARG